MIFKQNSSKVQRGKGKEINNPLNLCFPKYVQNCVKIENYPK